MLLRVYVPRAALPHLYATQQTLADPGAVDEVGRLIGHPCRCSWKPSQDRRGRRTPGNHSGLAAGGAGGGDPSTIPTDPRNVGGDLDPASVPQEESAISTCPITLPSPATSSESRFIDTKTPACGRCFHCQRGGEGRLAPLLLPPALTGARFAGGRFGPLVRGAFACATFAEPPLPAAPLPAGLLLSNADGPGTLGRPPISWSSSRRGFARCRLAGLCGGRLGFTALPAAACPPLAGFTSEEESSISLNSSISSSSVRSRHSPTGSPLEADVHDADALELGHLEAEMLAHAADLAVQPLH